jgi:hypothetical protein
MKKTSRLMQEWKRPPGPGSKVMVNVNVAFEENEGGGSVGSIMREFWSCANSTHNQ